MAKYKILEDYRRCALIKNWILRSETLRYFFHVLSDVLSNVRVWGHYKNDMGVYLFSRKYLPEVKHGPVILNMRYSPEKEYNPLFSIKYYGELCNVLVNDQRCRFLNVEQYIDGDFDKNSFNVVLRHDIDTKFCIEKIKMFVDVEQKCGLNSSVYFITDGSRYKPEEARKVVEELKNSGCLIGLHTLAHGSFNPREYLEFEISQFELNYGFRPRSYIRHGISPRPGSYRKTLSDFKNRAKKIDKILNIKGYNKIDLGERKYSERFIRDISDYKATITVPTSDLIKTLYYGGVFTVITHPWMWVDDRC